MTTLNFEEEDPRVFVGDFGLGFIFYLYFALSTRLLDVLTYGGIALKKISVSAKGFCSTGY